MDEMDRTVQIVPEYRDNDLLYRLSQEKAELENNILRLHRFLSKPADDLSVYHQDLMAKQFSLMLDYWDVLNKRMLDIILNHKAKK